MKREDVECDALSSFLTKLLIQRGNSLTDVAKALGVSKSYISRVHSGQRGFTLRHLRILEDFLGEPVPLLFAKATPLATVPKKLRPMYQALQEMAGHPFTKRRKSKAA